MCSDIHTAPGFGPTSAAHQPQDPHKPLCLCFGVLVLRVIRVDSAIFSPDGAIGRNNPSKARQTLDEADTRCALSFLSSLTGGWLTSDTLQSEANLTRTEFMRSLLYSGSDGSVVGRAGGAQGARALLGPRGFSEQHTSSLFHLPPVSLPRGRGWPGAGAHPELCRPVSTVPALYACVRAHVCVSVHACVPDFLVKHLQPLS